MTVQQREPESYGSIGDFGCALAKYHHCRTFSLVRAFQIFAMGVADDATVVKYRSPVQKCARYARAHLITLKGGIALL